MKHFILLVLCGLVAVVSAFQQNPTLAGLGDETLYEIPNCAPPARSIENRDVLVYSAMVYDHHRHKILAFGGGHATSTYPSQVPEFDFQTLAWTHNIDLIDCLEAYVPANVLTNSSGERLGGILYNGKKYCASTHTYDRMVMAADTCIMLIIGGGLGGSGKGCSGISEEVYAQLKGGGGLFKLLPDQRKWDVSERADMSSDISYGITAVNPNEPDWFYATSSSMRTSLYKINWRTEEKVKLASKPSASNAVDHSMAYCPEDNCLYEFTNSNGNVYKYDITNNSWTNMNPSGPQPNYYSANVVWDTLQKVFCSFTGGSGSYKFHYYSPSENKWYERPASYPLERIWHHHIYDPVNNVHLIVTGAGNYNEQWRTFAFKFSDTAGKFPGTGIDFSSVSSNVKMVNGKRVFIEAAPNPFNSRTVIRVNRSQRPEAKGQNVEIKIYDVNGHLVYNLASGIWHLASGISWNASRYPAGVYTIVLTIGKHKAVKKIFLLK